jgi:hypothetical protein
VSLAVFSKKLWDPDTTLDYGFLDGSDNKMKVVEDALAVWVQYANIKFDKRSDASKAVIRVSFAGQGSWSLVGADAITVKDPAKPTVNLGWLADRYPPSAEDRAIVLHEFGHALGMMHEHQSPARGERITLNELEAYNYYRPLLQNNDSLVKSQVIDVYNLSTVSNFSHLDLQSIMMYFMPAKLNREGIDIPVNLELSPLDKAFMTLNYPRKNDDAEKAGGMKVLDACVIASVPSETAGIIAGLVDQGDYKGARDAFSKYNQSVSTMYGVNGTYLDSINASQGIQFGIFDFVGSVISNPIFTSVVKNVVGQVFAQRGITTAVSSPGTAQHDVMNAIGTLITHPDFAKAISDINAELVGVSGNSAAVPAIKV